MQDQTRKIQKAKADKPFRPLGVPSYCNAVLSTLQRMPNCKKLRAVPSYLPEQANIEFTIGRQDFALYPCEGQTKLSIWNRSTQRWELFIEPLENFYPWLATKKTQKFDIKSLIFSF